MKYVVFVSVDKPARWSQWHSGSSDTVYRSEAFDTKEQAEEFKAKVKADYPDSNLTDGTSGHEWFIRFAVIACEREDNDNFGSICRMMHSIGMYEKEE